MSNTEFFEQLLGAKLTNQMWSWGALNPKTEQIFLSVWKHDLEDAGGVERIAILKPEWNKGSLGFDERKRHVDILRNGADAYGVLCTAKKDRGGRPRIGKYDSDLLLKLGEIIDEGDDVYARIIDRVPVEEVTGRHTSHKSIVADLRSIRAGRGDTTTKESLANARVGQGLFRARVLAMWGAQCCVTGSKTLDAIRASHIKPWRNSDNTERLDPSNGLPLLATLDALFDAGLVTFGPDGTLLTSSLLHKDEKRLLGIKRHKLSRRPNRHTARYLRYHREHVFVDGKGAT